MSGGERKRLYLVRLLLENPNFLILDEPTNDFDIFTMNILEQFLENYEGCILIVSHDRYFMDKTADSLFIMEEDGNISGFVGKCSEYIAMREEMKKECDSHRAEISKNSEKSTVATVHCDSGNYNNSGSFEGNRKKHEKQKLSFKEQREFEELDAEIPTLESEQQSLEEKMSSSNFSEAQKAGKRYNELLKLLEEKYSRWEELAERV